MNEKITRLAKLASMGIIDEQPVNLQYTTQFADNFSKLIVQECTDLLERDAQDCDEDEWGSLATAIRDCKYKIMKHFEVK